MAHLGVVVRAHMAAWRAHWLRVRARLGWSRHVLTSAALVVCGLAGAAAGGWLIARWALGLVLICESGGAVWMGLMRDDGAGLPRRGERTVAEVLEEQRRYP